MLWSHFPNEGWASIETKLCLFILPILFSTESYLDKKSITWIASAFILSCLLSFIYSLGYAIYHFHAYGMSSIFTRMNISAAIMHPGYYANYFALAGLFIITDYFATVRIWPRWIHIICSIFFLIVLILLSSKTVFLWLVCLCVYILWKSFDFIKNIPLRIAGSTFALLCLLILGAQLPPVKKRIQENKTEKSVHVENPQYKYSTEARMAAYPLAWQLIEKNPIIGYGTGSANPLLLHAFAEKKYEDLLQNKMHTHQQIMHTWIDTGIVGICLLIGLGIYWIIAFIRHQQIIGIWLSILCLFNLLTDDMFEIQAGIVFFIFFLMLLSFPKQKNIRATYH